MAIQSVKEKREEAAVQNIAALANYDPKKANLLMPTTEIMQVSPWHQIRVTAVNVNQDPNYGEVFPVEAKPIKVFENGKLTTKYVDQFALAKPALMKIAQAAGITWHYPECRPITVSRDYVLYQAVGGIRLPAGNWQVIPAKKEIDLTVIEDELMEQNLKKAKELAAGDKKDKEKLQGMTPEEWAKAKTRAAMIQWRKHKLARAETGAMERVIRAALSMKQAYTKDELDKPFLVPRIDFSPDYSDPTVQRMLIENGVKAMSNLFSAAAPAGMTASMMDMSNPNNIIRDIPDDMQDFSGEHVFEDDGNFAGSIDDEEATSAGELQDHQDEAAEHEGGAEHADSGHTNGASDRTCHECGAEITERVYQYSIENIGMPLCYKCQKKK